MWKAEHETRNAKRGTPNAKHGTRNAKHETRNAEHGTRNAKHGTPNAEHGTRNAEHRTRNTKRGTRNTELFKLQTLQTTFSSSLTLNFRYCDTSINTDTTLAARSAEGMLYHTPFTPYI